jgi:hypothetical protein
VTGQGGIVFVTDLYVENPSASAVDGVLSFSPAGRNSISQVSITMQPGQTLNYFDVVANRLGVSNSVGALHLWTTGGSTAALRVTSRTYASVDGATLGQAVPGVVFDENAGPRFVTGLVSSEEARTNLGAVNASPYPQRFDIALYSSNGVRVGVASGLELQPGHQMQWSLSGLFPSAAGKGLTAEFRPAPGSTSPNAYGAVVDNESGDPTYYPAIRPGPVVYLPGVARVTGLGLTTFASDISFANPSDDPVLLRVTFLEKEKDNSTGAPSTLFVVPGRSARQVDDALMELFGLSETFGALKVECPAGGSILVSERMFTVAANGAGTVGQQVDALSPDQFMSHGSVLGLRQDGAFRSNVGFFNPNPFAVPVELILKTSQNATLAGTWVNIQPHSYFQKNLAVLFPGTAFPGGQNLTLVANAGPHAVYPFGVIVDNQSQDLTFSPGLK